MNVWYWIISIMVAASGWVVYVTGRRRGAVHPTLRMIRQRLLLCADHTYDQARQLAVDSDDPLARAWNSLVERVGAAGPESAAHTSGSGTDNLVERFEQQRMKSILDALSCGVLCLDQQQRCQYVNRAGGALLHTDPESSAGKQIGEMGLSEGLVDVFETFLQGQGSAGRPRDYSDKDDADGTVLQISMRRIDEGPQAGAAVFLLSDVSQQRQVERTRTDLIEHVAHELRTPLTNIRAYSETLSEGLLDDLDAQRECYNTITAETQRLGRLIEDVLSISAMEIGAARMSRGRVDMSRLLRDCVQDSQAEADQRKIQLSLHISRNLPAVMGDRERLAILVNNLLGNAVKYSDEGGTVDVSCTCEDGQLSLTVADSGIGISADDLEKIFEKFCRTDNPEAQVRPGTGLGLTVARDIARMHGGDITVTSELGKGSEFTVSLPAVTEGEPALQETS